MSEEVTELDIFRQCVMPLLRLVVMCCVRMAARRFTTDEVIHLLWVFQVMEFKATNKMCLGSKGVLRLTQLMSVSVTATIQKKVWRR